MPYTKTTWTNAVTAVSQANMNNLETQFDEASQTMGTVDIIVPFVYSGGVCTIHGGLPKQMDVTTCIYYATQPDGNNTLRRRVVTATNFTTVTASTTYFLDYNADGTTSWGTAHSGVANYVPIASVTTDGSGNISVITDARVVDTNLLPNQSGGYIHHRGVSLTYILSNGGGAAGHVIWVGTTDPGGSAVEGDIWCKG